MKALMGFRAAFGGAVLTAAMAIGAVANAQEESNPSGITLGNGESNWIKVDDVTRADSSRTYTEQRITQDRAYVRRGDGTTLTFSEVHIEGDGWLVMHPFIDGAPNGDYVAGYSFVEGGTNKDVSITLNPAPDSGDMYIVMLHSDSNADGVFDFVFVDDTNVEDRAVFEGNQMIAHVIAVP
ncbi:MAG: hypothetical protein ABJN35_10230 [Erythrobacter sp.]